MTSLLKAASLTKSEDPRGRLLDRFLEQVERILNARDILHGYIPETATGTFTLRPSGPTNIDSSAGAVTGTLGSGTYVGQIKVIVMTEASNSSTVSVTNHSTSNPEVITFAAVDDVWIGAWTGTEWITVSLVGASV